MGQDCEGVGMKIPKYRVLRVIPTIDDQALEKFLNELKRPLLAIIDRGDYWLLICGEEELG